ncbi:DNA ligase 1-like isoform X2 [Ruditapes philippinarum]|uniref:DNA ligase 1-like isoform X2 n=1 Tax=Ruditapes philippinarum TaxID=129788 RepID=UPI00295BE532|nr:DNA ligase 1-like isoform X2 [Ruditapes philippinarum]
MSFLNCAGKNKKKDSKKGKAPRDPSPAYGAAKELTEDATIVPRLNDRLKEYEEKFRKLGEDLKDEKEKVRKFEQQVTDLKAQLKAKVKEDSNKVTEVAVTSSNKLLDEEKGGLAEQLQSLKKEFENEKKKGEEEINKVSEDLKKANKALETERNTGEAKLKKLENELKQAKEEIELEKRDRVKIEEEKEKCKREKDTAENKLAHTNKELEIAKKESHIPRSPTRAPSDEWKAKIENAEEELKKERDLRLEKERENSRLLSDKEILQKEKEELQNEVERIKAAKDEELENQRKDLEMNYKNDTQRLEQMITDMKESLKQAEDTKEKLLVRLSTQTAAHVLDNNPNVSDLSDPNRPQKLGEHLSQIYDDQWTDATEGLEKLGKNEEDILQTLLDILVAIYNHCKESAENQLARIDEDLFLPPLENSPTNNADTNGTEHLRSPTSSKHSMSKIPRFTSHKGSRPALPNISTEKKTVVKGEKVPEIPTEIRKGIKEYRKKVTKQVWPVIEKEVMTKLRKNDLFGEAVVEACTKYISKCVEVCWLMRVQDPPVTLYWNVPDDRSFNSDVYRAYTKSGTHVEYVVWPAMYLHEDGPLLMKGVAQGQKV